MTLIEFKVIRRKLGFDNREICDHIIPRRSRNASGLVERPGSTDWAGMTPAVLDYEIFEVVNFVATTHPMGQKRCYRGDGSQLSFRAQRTLRFQSPFCIF